MPLKLCQMETPCLHGGVCSTDASGVDTCTCSALFGGVRCEQMISCTTLPTHLELSNPLQFATMAQLECRHYLGRISLLPKAASDSVLVQAVLQSLEVIEGGLVIAGPISVSIASLRALELGAALQGSDTALSVNVSSFDFGAGNFSLHDVFISIVNGKLSLSSQQACPSDADIGPNPYWWAGLGAVNLVFNGTSGCSCALFPAEGSCVSSCELCPVVCSPEQVLEQLDLSID